MNVPFCKPMFGPLEHEKIKEALDSGWWTSGPMSEEFEKKFADYVGAKHCILVNSCSSALYLAYMWHRIHGAKKFLVPSLTFAATATEVAHAGGEVVFGDVDVDTMCLHKNEDKEYDVAVPVHLTGTPAYTKQFECPVVEDSAHRIQRDQCKGSKNTVCFSFYATKNLAMGEGGAICTNDDELAAWARLAKHHGLNKNGWNRYKGGKNWGYQVEFPGFKMNCPDLLAAVGLAQLERLDDMNAMRKHAVDRYNELFGYTNDGLHLYPILVEERDKFVEHMKENGIGVSVHFLPLHKMPGLKQDVKLPNTEYISERIVSLPLYPEIENQQLNYVAGVAKDSGLLIK